MGDLMKEKIKEIFDGLAAIRERVEKGVSKSELEELEEKVTKRLEEIEAKLRRPILSGATEVTEEEKAFFDFYVRKGEIPPERKDLFVSDDTAGGYLAPFEFVNKLITSLHQVSPVRQYATVITISRSGVEIPKDIGLPTTYWQSEKDSPVISTGEEVGMETIPVHNLTSEPKVSLNLLQDSAFDVVNWLLGKLALAFGIAEGQAFISGNGVNKPEGLLQHSGVASVNSGNASSVTADALLDMLAAIKAPYSQNGVFLMNMKTFVSIMKLKDNQGNYLLSPNLLAKGVPLTLLGHEVGIAPDMPDVATNAYPIIFGDIKSAYLIVDRSDMSILRDPYTAKPFVLFYTTKRVGGQVVLAEAICKMKITA